MLLHTAFSSCGEQRLLSSRGAVTADSLGRSTGSGYLGFSSGGVQVLAARSMWNLPRPGIKPTSTAPPGGFPSAAPPGKSNVSFSIQYFTHSF